MLCHEQKINQQYNDEVAFKAAMSFNGKNQDKVKWKGYTKRRRREGRDSQEKEKRRNKSQIECYRCIDVDIIDLSVASIEIERVVADLTLQK